MTTPWPSRAILTLLACLTWATPALATSGPPEQLIPDNLPIDAESLWFAPYVYNGLLRFEGIIAGNTSSDLSRFDSDGLRARSSDAEPRRGPTLRFPDDGRLQVASTTAKLLPETSKGSPSGATISLWYEARAQSVKIGSFGPGGAHTSPLSGTKVVFTALTGPHGLSNEASVEFYNTTAYAGRWRVTEATATTFVIEGAVWDPAKAGSLTNFVERGRSWWDPVWSLGAAGSPEPWRMALVLDDGVPTLALRHGRQDLDPRKQTVELFNLNQRPPQTGYVPSVDDHKWHHIAIRITREHCGGQRCPTVKGVPYPAQPARFALYVDGEWRGEEIALAPLALDELVIGELDVPGETYNQPNFNATPPRLLAKMSVSALQVFDTPLGESEIVELYRWGKAGYTQHFPQRPLAQETSNATTTRANAAAPGASAPPSDLLGVAKQSGTNELATYTNADVSDSSTSTNFAWIRTDAYSTSPILWFNNNDSSRVAIAFTDGGLKATCNGQSSVAQYATPALGRFQLITLVERFGQTFLGQDGHPLIDLGRCSSQSLGSKPRGTTFSVAPNRWLAWAGHFDRGLSPAEVAEFLAPGPRIWDASNAGATAIDDPTGLSGLKINTFAQSQRIYSGGWFTNDVRSADQIEAQYRSHATRPVGLDAPATGILNPDNGQAPLTVSFQVRLPRRGDDNVTKTTRVLLARRGVVGGFFGFLSSDFEAYAVCSLVGSYPDVQRGCYLEIIAGVGVNRAGRRFRVNQPLDHKWDINGVQTDAHHVAIAWGPARTIPGAPGSASPAVVRTEPTVAIDGVLINQRHLGQANRIIDLGEAPAHNAYSGRDRAPREWRFGPHILGAALTSAADAPEGVRHDVELLDIRVYPYARQDIDRIIRDDRAEVCALGGRVFANPAPALGGHCGECLATHFAVGGNAVSARDCREDQLFTDPCAANDECVGDAVCYRQRCLTTSKSDCDTECGELGRACQAQANSWRCQSCKAGFKVNTNNFSAPDDWEYACSWQPDKQPGDLCGGDAECTNAWCVPARSGTFSARVRANPQSRVSTKTDSGGGCSATCRHGVQYYSPNLESTQWSHPARCGLDTATGPGECIRALAKTEQVTKVAPDGRSFTSVRCRDGFDAQCVAGAEKRWLVLSPQACRVALDNAPQEHVGSCDSWYKAFSGCQVTDYSSVKDSDRRKAMLLTNEASFDLVRLKQAFLGDSTPWKREDEARLIRFGVGPRLIAYAAGTIEEKRRLRQAHGPFLPLISCATEYQDSQSAFNIQGANGQACEPQLQPDGAACPPPATIGSGRAGWEFCESRFCDDRDSKTCKPGGRTRNKMAGKGGNKSRKGKSAVKFGIVRVDDTAVDIIKNDKVASDETPAYTATVSQRYVPCILGVQFPPIDIFSMTLDIDRKKPECASEKFTLRILGYKLNAPKSGGVASCSTVNVSVSADAEVCFKGPSCTLSVESLENAVNVSQLIPSFKVCLPADAIGVKLPEKKKTFFEAVVPIRVGIGLTLDPCLNLSAGFASNGMPQVEIKPSIAVGVEARAGIGFGSDEGDSLEVSAGAKIALTLVELSFPIRWLFSLDDVVKNGATQLGLFDLKLKKKVSLELDILSGWMGLYAELTLGPFGLDWEFPIFKWQGFFFSFDLSDKTIGQWRLDFQAAFNRALAAGQTTPKAACDGNNCLK